MNLNLKSEIRRNKKRNRNGNEKREETHIWASFPHLSTHFLSTECQPRLKRVPIDGPVASALLSPALTFVVDIWVPSARHFFSYARSVSLPSRPLCILSSLYSLVPLSLTGGGHAQDHCSHLVETLSTKFMVVVTEGWSLGGD